MSPASNGGEGRSTPSSPSFSEMARRVAAANPDVASYQQLADEMLREVEGYEVDLLAKLLPGYMRAILSRRSKGGTDEEVWESFLAERIPSRNRGTIFMREATRDDLDDAIARRRKFAGNLDRRALQMQQVQQSMVEHKVEVVAQLPNSAHALRDVETRLREVRAERLKTEGYAKAVHGLERTKALLESWIADGDTPVLQRLRAHRAHLTTLVSDQLLANRRAEIRRELLEELRGTG